MFTSAQRIVIDTQPGHAEDALPLSNQFFRVRTTYDDDGHPRIIMVTNLLTEEELEYGTQAAAAKYIEEQTALLKGGGSPKESWQQPLGRPYTTGQPPCCCRKCWPLFKVYIAGHFNEFREQ